MATTTYGVYTPNRRKNGKTNRTTRRISGGASLRKRGGQGYGFNRNGRR